jgi:hypothetical protein
MYSLKFIYLFIYLNVSTYEFLKFDGSMKIKVRYS